MLLPAGTAAAVLRFCTAVAGLSPAATATVSRMRSQKEVPSLRNIRRAQKIGMRVGLVQIILVGKERRGIG
jgi:hypothetical protein